MKKIFRNWTFLGLSILLGLAILTSCKKSSITLDYSIPTEQVDTTTKTNIPDPGTEAVLTMGLHTYFVATTGKDTASGTLTSPFLTIQKAQSVAIPGDIIYIRGGNYVMDSTQVAKKDNLYAYCNYMDKSGNAFARIQYIAYPGERPVFDFSRIKPSGLRVTGFFVSGSYLTFKGFDVIGTQVTITTHTQSENFRNEGSYNIYENLRMHNSMANGFYLTRGGHNLILNCDAYENWDDVSEDKRGGNTDGFGCHPYKQGAGYTDNVFRGCRAWFNSDDGFDCINAFEAITYEDCWAFYNGYSKTFENLHDGNGFKGGGFGVTDFSNIPAVIPRHTFRFCLAVGNKASGFYANHHLGGSDWYNNTAYRNAINFNMLNRSQDYASDVPGYGHVLKNNLAYKGRSSDVGSFDPALNTTANNSFQMVGLSVSDASFASLDESFLTQPRQTNFSLPSTQFLRLLQGSNLIDQGVDIGFPYLGSAPDLGCFEFGNDNSPIAVNSTTP